MPRRQLLHLALLLVLALVAGPAPSPLPASAETTTASADEQADYPISGFFVAPAASDAANADRVQRITRVGGDTLVTFGSTLRKSTLGKAGRIRTDGDVDPAFTSCRIEGKPCAAVATKDVDIRRVLTFANHSHFTKGAVQCPRDRTFTSKGQQFTLLLLPTQGDGCTSPNGRYDLVAINAGPTDGVDRTASLLRAAERADVDVYVGMPTVQTREDVEWLPDMSYADTLDRFTDRFLGYHRSVTANSALTGFYHHTEMPVAAGDVWEPVLDLYRLQNRAIAEIFPDKAALVSPYLDNRRSANQGLDRAQLEAKTETGARAIAGTAEGVPLRIAVQDGMGTGKAGSYLVNDANSPVDQQAASLVGRKTWDSAYLMPVGDSFRAAKAGLEGTGATLWANVEGMTPEGGTDSCGSGQERGRTTKSRLDHQVQAVGRYSAKNISYMWNPFYTCRVGGSRLAQDITRHGSAPLVVNAAIDPQRDALWLSGYNLADSRATVKYVDTDGAVHEATADISGYAPDYGRRAGLDRGLGGASYQVDFTSPQRGKIFLVWVTGEDGVRSSHAFSLHHR